jgi:hypothetical protein
MLDVDYAYKLLDSRVLLPQQTLSMIVCPMTRTRLAQM